MGEGQIYHGHRGWDVVRPLDVGKLQDLEWGKEVFEIQVCIEKMMMP